MRCRLPDEWIELTGGGELSQLHEAPDMLQRQISRCVNKLVAKAWKRTVSKATHYGAVTQAQRFRDVADARCGDVYRAMPWIDSGELDLITHTMKKTLVTRFALNVPFGIRDTRSGRNLTAVVVQLT